MTRVMWGPSLRETFAFPFFMLLLLAIVVILKYAAVFSVKGYGC